MKARWIGFVLIGAWGAACDDGKPIADDVKGGSPGCIETSKVLSSVSESGLSSEEVQAVEAAVAESPTGELAWRDGSRTQITGVFTNLEAVKIESHEDPSQLGDFPRQCFDRVSLKMNVELTTADGRLDEHLQGVMFDRKRGRGAWTAFPHKTADELEGQYVRQLEEQGTFTALYFDLLLSPDAFAGSVSEETWQGRGVGLSASLGTW